MGSYLISVLGTFCHLNLNVHKMGIDQMVWDETGLDKMGMNHKSISLFS